MKKEELNNPKVDASFNIEDLNTGTDTSFKNLSRFNEAENQHIISLGIQLSKNHPVLNNFSFHKEMQDKIKGLLITVSPDYEVST
jgi:hypothetical protein